MAIAPEVIHAIALDVPGVVNCHDIASRGVLGRQVLIEMHLIVDAPDVETAHRITQEVEKRLEERFSPVRIVTRDLIGQVIEIEATRRTF